MYYLWNHFEKDHKDIAVKRALSLSVWLSMSVCLTPCFCPVTLKTDTGGIHMIQNAFTRHLSWSAGVTRASCSSSQPHEGKAGSLYSSDPPTAGNGGSLYKLACSIPFSLSVCVLHTTVTTWKSNWPLGLLKTVCRRMEPQRHKKTNSLKDLFRNQILFWVYKWLSRYAELSVLWLCVKSLQNY